MKPLSFPTTPEPTALDTARVMLDQWRRNTGTTLRVLYRTTQNVKPAVDFMHQLMAQEVEEFYKAKNITITEART